MIRSVNIFFSQILINPVYRVLLVILGALFLSLNLACFGYPVMAWFGLVPLILLNKSSQRFFDLLTESFLFFFIYNLLSFAWLFSIHPLKWLGVESLPSILIAGLAWILPSLYHSIFLLFFSSLIWIFYRLKDRTALEELSIVEVLILAFIWSLIQYKIFASTSDFSIFAVPINQLAYSQYLSPSLSKLVSFIGAAGLEIVIVSFNLLLANLVHIYDFHKTRSRIFYSSGGGSFELTAINSHIKTGIAIAVILFLLGISALNSSRKPLKALSFTLVQANLNRKDTRVSLKNLDSILELQERLSVLKQKRHLLFWTEASIPADLTNFNRNDKVRKLISRLQNYYQYFIFGSYSSTDQQLFNSLKLVNIKEKELRTYNKVQLVPFGEYTPFLDIFPSVITKLAQSTIGNGFSAGAETQKLLEFDDVKVGSSICFELLFPDLIRQQTRAGANFLVNINDLSWFQSDNMKKLFLAVAVMRAMENHKDLVLVGNTGHSALIKRDGTIYKLSPVNKSAILRSSVGLDYSKSFYSEFGW